MKQIAFLLTLFLLSIYSTLNGQAPNWGEPDTLAHHKLGPGINYSNIYFKGKKMLIWVTEVDLTNPYNKIEQVQSRHQAPDLVRWTVQEHYRQNSRPGHKVCVAFNHDFFSYEAGICIGMNVSEGEIPYGNGAGRSTLAIDKNKKASVFHSVLDARVILPDQSSVKIDRFNRAADGMLGDCILFNRFNSMELVDAGRYIKIVPQGEWVVNGQDVQCLVKQISDNPLQSSASEYVIYLRGSKLNAMDMVRVGETVKVSQKLTNGSFGNPLSNILNAFHGYPSIAYDGKLHDGEYNNFEGGREYEISSRTMAGISQDGNKLYVVTTEMSPTSAGVNCIDLANYMLSIGAWNVVNFDSGGSAAIVVDEVMLNYPARGAVRPVMDALLAVSLAPESATPVSFSFIKPSIRPVAASTVQLTLLEYNQYDEVLTKDAKGFKFTCIPEALGYVDENQKFHVGSQSLSGRIIAEKNGMQSELLVFSRPVDNVAINPANILIDKRSFPIAIETTIDNSVFAISPDMFLWEIDNPLVCSIEQGILKGLSNGETLVTGTFGNHVKTMSVKVEIGRGKQTAESFSNMTDFIVKSAGVTNLVLSNTTSNNDAVMEFDYLAGRVPYLELAKDQVIYGLPDSLTWRYFNQDNIVKELFFYFEDANGNSISHRTDIQKLGEQNITVPFATDGKAWGVPSFPIKLKKIRMNLNPVSMKKKYNIPFGCLYAHYPEGEVTGMPSLDNKQLVNLYLRDQLLHIDYHLACHSSVSFQLYSIEGNLIQQHAINGLAPGEYQHQFDVVDVPAGVYIVKVNLCQESVTRKVIVH